MARYSYSKLGTYRACPLQYRFRYIDKVRVDVAPSIEAFMGSRVHDALEGLYKQVANGRSPSRDDVLSLYEQGWDAERTGDLRIVDDTLDEAAYRAVGRRCLELYITRYAPFDDGLVIGLEDGFQIPLGEDLILNGFIDRLMKHADGVYEVHDYKTSRRLPTPEEARADEQGGWYALAVRRRFPHARDIRLVWHYLRHDEELVSTRTPQEIERLERDIVRRVRAIEAAVDFPAQESPLCAWCDYLAVCPAKGHSLAVAALSPNEFRAEPGVNLVNRLAELRTTLKTATAAAEDEIVGVEEALLAYARQHGYTVVVGDEMEAVIDDSADLLLPRKDDPRRPALEDAVRQLGLWDTVSDLSLSKLEKTLAENAIPLDARRRIERFAATEPKTTLRLRKRRAAADR